MPSSRLHAEASEKASLIAPYEAMEERRAPDVYRRAEQELTSLASAIQRQDPLDSTVMAALAKDIAESIGRNDQLVVQALAGPSGSTLITNLINVSILATKVGSGLGYYGKELERLTLAGLMHDIGLFAVPQSIVTKSGRLTQEERTLIEQHPELGYQLVRKLGTEWEWLAQLVRQAHERWNGRGYPNRLKGREIHEMAQIIGVVDVFDALVTPRPYRRRFFPHEAVRELLVAERSAFPREILKTLVEQLSAYPLGTLVRLTTGEVGVVVGTNVQFPLRPIVAVESDNQRGNGPEKREIDLSLSPLVSIIETVESPAVARVSFTSGLSSDRRSKHVPTVSDQFASLLENLDALATAIQGVVESRTATASSDADSRSDRWSPGRPTAQETVDTSFEKEVVGLFALEAHEWLAQIHSAVKRLAEGANGPAKSKLYGIMLQGLTNLARSAATVHLTSIEEMALKLLPTLHDVGRQDPRAMAAALAALQSGLQRISAAVRHAEGMPEEPPQTCEAAEAPAFKLEPPVSSMRMTSGASLLSGLRELQQVRSRSLQPARDVLDAVILRAEQEGPVVSVDSIRRILDELDRMDERFVEEVGRRIPVISRILADLKKEGTTDFITSSQVSPLIEQVEALHDVAEAVQAGMITMFLQGLRAFLMVATYRKNTTLAQRLTAVDSRIQALVPMAEQWVSIGRVERAAIAEILPVG